MATVTYGHHALIGGNRSAAIEGTLITIILAIIFTSLQGFEYIQAPFSIADGAFGSAFFVSTGLHGFTGPLLIKLKSFYILICQIFYIFFF